MAVTLPVLSESSSRAEAPLELSTQRIGNHMLKLARLELTLREGREHCATQHTDIEQTKAALLECERQLGLRETALAGREAELGARRTSLRRQAEQIEAEHRKVADACAEWRARFEELEHCEALVREFDKHFEQITANFQLDSLRDEAVRLAK